MLLRRKQKAGETKGKDKEVERGAHLCHFLKVLMAFLQCSGTMERFPHSCVFTEERLTVVLNPVQHLHVGAHTYTHTRKSRN